MARKRLEKLISEFQNLRLLKSCGTGVNAIESINAQQPDVIFLDIQLKDMDGFEVLKKISPAKQPLVVFATAYDSYAIQAFDVFAFDYLLKPFKKNRLKKTVDQVTRHFQSNADPHIAQQLNSIISQFEKNFKKASVPNAKNRILLKQGNSEVFVLIEDIKYILSSGSYIEVHTIAKKYVQRVSMGDFLKYLNRPEIVRIHRSTAINTNRIQRIVHSDYGEIEAEMESGKRFRISKSYRQNFKQAIEM